MEAYACLYEPLDTYMTARGETQRTTKSGGTRSRHDEKTANDASQTRVTSLSVASAVPLAGVGDPSTRSQLNPLFRAVLLASSLALLL
jgi:hypothetical protein